MHILYSSIFYIHANMLIFPLLITAIPINAFDNVQYQYQYAIPGQQIFLPLIVIDEVLKNCNRDNNANEIIF